MKSAFLAIELIDPINLQANGAVWLQGVVRARSRLLGSSGGAFEGDARPAVCLDL
jgi:hypothetical protein